MNFSEELASLLAANIPLINLVTYEEERAIRAIAELAARTQGVGVYTWDLADGFVTIRPGQDNFPIKDVTTETILPHLADKMPQNTVVILKDFHHSWAQKKGYITRKLRNMAPELRKKNQFLVFTTPILDLPAELKDDVLVLHVPLPDATEMERLFVEQTRHLDQQQLPKSGVRAKLISSALGLTTNQARLAFSRVWARYRKFDEQAIELVTWAKREVIRESGALEFWPAEEGEADVGGLDLLKAALKDIEVAFSPDARAQGIPLPRGVALIGIPGTGKSLSAKMLSGLWRMPLLRLDMAAVFESLLGESEKQMRRAIMLAETVSPCILWIDEMEKAFAGVGSGGGGSSGSGAPTRVFGSFLTWMQEHKTPVFVVATANDVGALSPELMARFNAGTFFLDLPNAIERREIFLIHLRRTGETFPERKFRMDDLVERSRGLVGREIERVINEAWLKAFKDGNREIEQADLMRAMENVKPISESHAQVIDGLRKWKTEGWAMPASSPEQAAPSAPRGRVIETN